MLPPRRMAVPTPTAKGPRRRFLAQRPEWSVSEYVCTAGPEDRPFEEQHNHVSVALVTAGTFQYRADTGSAMLYPGAFLLGNDGACFECDHEHGTGDRCLAVHISRQLFEEVAASSVGSSRFRFPTPMLPSRPELASIAASLQCLPTADTRLEIDEAVLALVETVVGLFRVSVPSPPRLAAYDARRLSAVLRYIESRSAAPLDLGELAAVASMSKYHFLRTFRRATGTTPYRHILGTRLRRVASALVETRLPVSTIALNEGFGDLSTFNRLFRRMIGTTPTRFRSAV